MRRMASIGPNELTLILIFPPGLIVKHSLSRKDNCFCYLSFFFFCALLCVCLCVCVCVRACVCLKRPTNED